MGYEQKGQYAEALASLETAKSLDESPWISAVTSRILARLSRMDEAQKILDELTEPENVLQTDGSTDLNRAGDVCISGLDGYHKVEKAVRFPFARPNNVPEFETK